ncbi:MAG: hypothetical protein K0U78_15310 [Actinomycetia bacterium]|nr:hypothetical protein [Actinomycetes bacterium]
MTKVIRKFEGSSAKSYKDQKNAQKVVDKITEEVKGIDYAFRLNYVFVLNTDNRVQIMFMVDQCDFSTFVHYLIEKGHLVQVM